MSADKMGKLSKTEHALVPISGSEDDEDALKDWQPNLSITISN
jgi:hypothetical protein